VNGMSKSNRPRVEPPSPSPHRGLTERMAERACKVIGPMGKLPYGATSQAASWHAGCCRERPAARLGSRLGRGA
jgi:hypothetical protein